VAEELGGVLGRWYPGVEQHVPPGGCCGDADHLSSSGRAPRVSHADGGVGLAGAGRADDQLGAARAGQHEERGRGLVQAQPAARVPISCGRARAQLCVQLRQVSAEQRGSLLAAEMGRACCARVRD
jgi:hypothetical protein